MPLSSWPGLWIGIDLTVWAAERYRRRLENEIKVLRAERRQQATLVRFLITELRRRDFR